MNQSALVILRAVLGALVSLALVSLIIGHRAEDFEHIGLDRTTAVSLTITIGALIGAIFGDYIWRLIGTKDDGAGKGNS